mmetsp:Transcript_20651/g.36674  ORF Transcript_20651/g.36674 Transcript_20651/m.36674 type:complete len:270 (+) Transcript_20651:533-1342(+)
MLDLRLHNHCSLGSKFFKYLCGGFHELPSPIQVIHSLLDQVGVPVCALHEVHKLFFSDGLLLFSNDFAKTGVDELHLPSLLSGKNGNERRKVFIAVYSVLVSEVSKVLARFRVLFGSLRVLLVGCAQLLLDCFEVLFEDHLNRRVLLCQQLHLRHANVLLLRQLTHYFVFVAVVDDFLVSLHAVEEFESFFLRFLVQLFGLDKRLGRLLCTLFCGILLAVVDLSQAALYELSVGFQPILCVRFEKRLERFNNALFDQIGNRLVIINIAG